MLKMTIMAILALLNITSVEAAGKTIECPVINCDTTIGEMICYEHSSDIPVTEINTFFCPEDRVCNLQKDKFSWVTSKLQDMTSAE